MLQEMWKSISGKKNNHPLTDDAFYQHTWWYAYQWFIWRNATTSVLNLPDPTDYGYVNDDNMLQPRLMTQGVSAPELVNAIVCLCENYCPCTCS